MEFEQKQEIKKIYEAGIKEGRSNFEIFQTLIKFYPEANKPVRGNSDWFKFIKLVGPWKKEAEEKERDREISDDEAEEIQNQNRKKTITLLARFISDAQKNPKGIKDWELSKIMSFYKTIQSAEEAKKKTDIARNKIKSKSKRTIFPYKRLSDEEINNLQKEINESFTRIRQDRAGEDK